MTHLNITKDLKLFLFFVCFTCVRNARTISVPINQELL